MGRKRVLFLHSDNSNYMHANAARSKLGIVAIYIYMHDRGKVLPAWRGAERRRGSSALTISTIFGEPLSPSQRTHPVTDRPGAPPAAVPHASPGRPDPALHGERLLAPLGPAPAAPHAGNAHAARSKPARLWRSQRFAGLPTAPRQPREHSQS